jgi:tetratricopeptide (TPR) repeat protein
MNSPLQGLSPDVARQLASVAAALDAGQVDRAEQALALLSPTYREHPEVLRMQAGVHDQHGRHPLAIATMRRALALRPRDPLYHNTLGALLGNAGDYETAIDSLRTTCALLPGYAPAWYNLGVMLTKCVRNDEAATALAQAVAIEPHHLAAHALHADILRMQGRVDDARATYRRLIKQRPVEGAAWWGLADLRTEPFTRSDVAQMRTALQHPQATAQDRVAIGFALAKALEEAGDYPGVLAALAQANAVARRLQAWDAPAFSAQVAAIARAFDEGTPGAPGPQGREVIFVVGLPRSGSTLAEQILATHSAVQGAGELPDLPLVLGEESRRRGVPFPQWVGAMEAHDWARLGQRYLERTARWRRERPIFVDKLPNNWIYVDAIRAMLPAARVVACRRDPLETCFSCYRQRLDNGNGYARSFADLASFWHDFDRSVKRLVVRHGQHVHELDYEALVREPEVRIHGLLAACELPFEAACLRFHENPREVRSPSASQVRQPIRRDTARSLRYGELLDPLRRALGLPAWRP